MSKRVWEVLEKGTDELGPIGHGWTYSAHPIGAAAGVANLQLIDKLGLVENAGKTGAYLVNALRERFADHPQVAEVRGEGMLAAIEFAAAKSPLTLYDPGKKIGPAVATALLKHNIIARAMPQGDILGFAPPLSITTQEVDIVLDGVSKAIKEVLG